ncbi:MFS transporter [Paraburkholderia sp. D15]|uniref:MFS transporter n=1 Tax=Paraburkholderia sp. D15 TaxID=2880218 RepID=UPI00247B1E60|nr:MFS transporter [Paraburkholderia sp. D15]WGS49319.1 MFS transporter [Paraburkholderia sp. D15]
MQSPSSPSANPFPHAAPAPLSRATVRRIVFSSSVGNALEWFDFLVYGYFATIIARQFFPLRDEWLSTLLAIATFGISFLMRPLGAVVLGIYGDRKGRKAALTLAIALMMVGTFTMAVMPPYASIGIAAPLLILLARLVQGFAVGGEFGSATAFMVEHSASRRGYYASWQFASQGLAAITAAAFGSLLTAWMPPEQLDSWGWRLPFVFGLLVGPVGYYIRSHLDETPEFLAMRQAREEREERERHDARAAASPIAPGADDKAAAHGASFANQWVNLLLAVGIVAQSTVGVYVLQLYMPMYAVKQLHMPAAASFGVVVLNGGLQFLLSPVMGALSDRIGRIRIMLTTSVLMGALIYPMFALLQSHPTIGWLLLLQGTAGIFKAAYSGPMPALMSEIFPTQVRSTGLSIGYSIGVTIFGGFAPTIVETFIHLTGDKLAPSYYVLIAAVLSGVSLVIVALRMRRVRAVSGVQPA